MLFDPARHEALPSERWDPDRARAAIAAITADALAAQHEGFWPRHPLDGDAPPEAASSLYYGAAGVLWALEHLARAGAVPADSRVGEWTRTLASRAQRLEDIAAGGSSYFVGAAGCAAARLARSARPGGPADTLGAGALRPRSRHVDHPTREAFLGSAGTAIAAVLAHEATGEERWRSLYLAHARSLFAAWERHASDRHELWTQDLYGAKRRLLGASHGFAGNVLALLRGWDLLDAGDRASLLSRATTALLGTAVIEEGFANWPISAGGAASLVQWCHGAPGIVTSFARAPVLPELDACLRRAGELVWRAGPLRKGPGLCHGTAGNGAAFLALFARGGDESWLERARRFAMHAIGQVEAARTRYGRGRYTLWTGDLGVAVYLWQCLEGEAGMPSLDF